MPFLSFSFFSHCFFLLQAPQSSFIRPFLSAHSISLFSSLLIAVPTFFFFFRSLSIFFRLFPVCHIALVLSCSRRLPPSPFLYILSRSQTKCFCLYLLLLFRARSLSLALSLPVTMLSAGFQNQSLHFLPHFAM